MLAELERQIGAPVPIHLELDGEYHLLAELPAASREATDQARAVGVAISRAAPACWFMLGRLFLRDGWFYRQRFGYRLELVRAADVHLSRPMRQLVRSLAPAATTTSPVPQE